MSSLADLAAESFVSLTTYRRSGEGVATPVWIGSTDGGPESGTVLAVTTADGSGKVKRIARDPHVTLRPCNRMGKVADDAPTVEARAEVVRDAGRMAGLVAPIKKKYGVQYLVVMAIEKVFGRQHVRVALRITAPD